MLKGVSKNQEYPGTQSNRKYKMWINNIISNRNGTCSKIVIDKTWYKVRGKIVTHSIKIVISGG